MINKLEVLGAQPKEESLLNNLDHFPTYTFKKGDYVLGKGDYFKNSILFIVQGKGIVYTKKIKQIRDLANSYFLPNSFLNLNAISLKTSRYHEEYAIAATSGVVKIIPLAHFQELLETNNILQQFVIQELLQISQQKQLALHRKVMFSSRRIISRFLIDYVKKAGTRMGYEWVIYQPFSMKQIGELTHTSRQSSSTLFNVLKKAGIIHFNKKCLIIRDLERLKDFTERLN